MKSVFIKLSILFAVSLVFFSWPQESHADKKNPMVKMKTNQGMITIELYPDKAPGTVENFIKLIDKKFYDGLIFHRYEPGFVIQGGDPRGNGTGGPGYTIKDEHRNGLKHVKGAVAMAKTSMPNSAGSQFYICLAPAHFLDNNYTVFGQVVDGMKNALKLRAGDTMDTVTVDAVTVSGKKEDGQLKMDSSLEKVKKKKTIEK